MLTGRKVGPSSIISSFDYTAFGSLLKGDASSTSYLHGAQFSDAMTKISYHRARFYLPTVARWASMDNYFDFLGNLGNSWSYVGHDPINKFDYSGNFSELEMTVGLAIVSEIAQYQMSVTQNVIADTFSEDNDVVKTLKVVAVILLIIALVQVIVHLPKLICAAMNMIKKVPELAKGAFRLLSKIKSIGFRALTYTMRRGVGVVRSGIYWVKTPNGVFKLWGASTVKAQQKMLMKLERKGIRTAKIIEKYEDGGKLILEDAGETCEAIMDRNPPPSPEWIRQYEEFQRSATDASGLPGFLTDIKARNIGYKNGEFIVFDPALLDIYTVLGLAAVGGAIEEAARNGYHYLVDLLLTEQESE